MSDSNYKTANMKPTKVVIPKVWKRPHSTIYGKNVEFGSKLTSDKLGEINGRKFNSELPWQVRNSSSSTLSSSGVGGSSSQGYLSKLLNEPESTLIGSVVHVVPATRYGSIIGGGDGGVASASTTRLDELAFNNCESYADVLDVTNPNRYSKRRRANELERVRSAQRAGQVARNRRIDFFENYLQFNRDLERMQSTSKLRDCEPLLGRRANFDKNLDFNYDIGLFVPSTSQTELEERRLLRKRTLGREQAAECAPPSSQSHFTGASWPPGQHTHSQCYHSADDKQHVSDINQHQCYNQHHFNPVVLATQQTELLPRHACQLASSPYGQSTDGRKLSLGSINPHSYRPSLPNKSSTLHASDGEEFEFQDRSSPFYTDRWAGRTIRHFDSDLYSNANLFKSMIL